MDRLLLETATKRAYRIKVNLAKFFYIRCNFFEAFMVPFSCFIYTQTIYMGIVTQSSKEQLGSGLFQWSSIFYLCYVYYTYKASCIFIVSGRWKSDQPPTLYIFINCSTRDLSYIEKYVVRSVGIRKSCYLIFTSKFARNCLQ